MNFIPKKILFRAWDLEEKTMHYECSVSSFHGCSSSNGKCNRHDVRSWMTWNGLSYSEGKNLGFILLQGIIQLSEWGSLGEHWIFEADIVKFSDLDNSEVKGYVTWNEGTNAFVVIDSNGVIYPLDSNVKYSVIGNVFEHPQLL